MCTIQGRGHVPAVVEEESADKVTAVLAAAAECLAGRLQAAPVDAGRVPVAAAGGTAPAVAAAEGPAGGLVRTLGSWIGLGIRGEPGNLAAVQSEWEAPAAGRTETGWAAWQAPESKAAETGGRLGTGQAGDPGTVGACGAVDRVVPPGCVELKTEGGAARGKATAAQADRVVAVSKGIAAGSDAEPDLAGCNTAPGPVSRRLLVPVGHKIPSKIKIYAHLNFRQRRTPLETILGHIYFWLCIHNPDVSLQMPSDMTTLCRC